MEYFFLQKNRGQEISSLCPFLADAQNNLRWPKNNANGAWAVDKIQQFLLKFYPENTESALCGDNLLIFSGSCCIKSSYQHLIVLVFIHKLKYKFAQLFTKEERI
jgi:hypothetical protein